MPTPIDNRERRREALKFNAMTLDFLKQFLFLTNSNQAVMITGPWGCGKTHAYKEHIVGMAKDKKYKIIYVSLLGMTSVEAIKANIASQILGPLTMNISGAESLMDGGIEIGQSAEILVGGAGVSQAVKAVKEIGLSVSSGLEDFAIRRALSGMVLFVFDDIERCSQSMQPEELFGYLATLVIGKNSKVLLIANEDRLEEVLRANDAKFNYGSIKEKLVSHTLSLTTDVNSFLTSTIQSIEDGDFKNSVIRKRAKLFDLFLKVPKLNLRSVKNGILNCNVLWSKMKAVNVKSEAQENKIKLMEHLLDVCMGATIFAKMGPSTAHRYLNMTTFHAMVMRHNEKQDKDKASGEARLEQLAKVLSDDKFYENEPKFVSDLIDQGFLDGKAIEQYFAMALDLTRTDDQKALDATSGYSVMTMDEAESATKINRSFELLKQGKVTHPEKFLSVSRALIELQNRGWAFPENVSTNVHIYVGNTSFDLDAKFEPRHSARVGFGDNVRLVEARINHMNTELLIPEMRGVFEGENALAFLGKTQDREREGEVSGLAAIPADEFWEKALELSNSELYQVDGIIRAYIEGPYPNFISKVDGWLAMGLRCVDAAIGQISSDNSMRKILLKDMKVSIERFIAAITRPEPEPEQVELPGLDDLEPITTEQLK